MSIVYKPWGREDWIELNDKYCYKRIYINSGSQTSYHYHEVKKETNYIISGKVEFWLENEKGVVEKKIMHEGESVTVLPPRKHRVVAITDAILQEVSTPEVDDVVRIEDDTNRPDGRLEHEHETPGVLILAAGKGERLKSLTEKTNKALIPINNQAVISKIIKKFPIDYKFVISLGYKGEMIEEYLKLSFPNHDFEFIYIDDIESSNSGPGYSALACKQYLKRPFYIITVDCLISSPLPPLSGNWLGVHQTGYPEKYSTVLFDDKNIIQEFSDKSVKGYDHAFIGIGAINDYEIFWNELENNIENGELVSAFVNPKSYPNFTAIEIDWYDTGNLDDLEKAKQYFQDKPLSLTKSNFEYVYKEEDKFIKLIEDQNRLKNLYTRGLALGEKIPRNISKSKNFLSYDWINGQTLYEKNDLQIFTNFLNEFMNSIQLGETNKDLIKKFYIDKTINRINNFIDIYGDEYYKKSYIVNDRKVKSIEEIMNKLDISVLFENPFTRNFHGDLQFDNIIESSDKFYFIDWRDNFAGQTEVGDIYYDFAKLYGGLIIPYNLMKNDDNIRYYENNNEVTFDYENNSNFQKVLNIFTNLINNSEFDLYKVELISGIIYLNMAPLHNEKFSKLLWFKAASILSSKVDK